MEEKKVIAPPVLAGPSKMFLYWMRAIAIDKEITDHLANGGRLEELGDKYPCFKHSPAKPVLMIYGTRDGKKDC